MDTRANTVDAVLRRSARRTPGRTALLFADRTWTYAELDDAVSRTAGWLRTLGVVQGDRVAAYGRNSDAYLLSFLGAARIGAVHVPINYALTGEELAYLVEQSGSRVLVVDPALAANVEALTQRPGQVVPMRDAPGSLLEAARTGEVPEIDVTVDDGDLAQLLYTSGTTSKPKGAMMTHRGLVHEYVSGIHALGMTEHDEPLHAMPLYHSAGMQLFMMPYLAVGATNHLMEAPDVPEILRRIEADRIGALFLAPTVWVPAVNHADFATRDLSSLRKAFYGASIMPGPILARLREQLPELGVYNCFGQSEIGPLATVLQPEEHDERPDSCGRPVLFVELRVIDDEGRDVAPGEAGEVVYRSPQLCEGYWDKPEETAEAFREGWFHSGDLVRIDEQGYITVVDRIKDVINTGGILVASREVEDALYTHEAVAEVAVIGTPDDRWIEAVTAFVVLRPEHAEGFDADALIEHAKARLAKFKVPKAVHLIAELPRNQSGKLLKRVLRDKV
ncbi:acyl-CoA synthetase [Actinomycetospora atypica]|uniref:Acyl-CoA synthetase n=1 Tax=Actinomycetospora atypica TaxID=1290095 RepID=A0ABV9YEB6_9PSEU